MKTKFVKRGIVICFMFFAICFTGCASGGRRFYSNQLRDIKDVSIVYANGDCRVDSIAETEKPKKDLEGGGSFLSELLPGDYIFNTRLVYMGNYSNTYGTAIDFPLNTKPGHVYYIYAESSGSSWHPTVIDIINDGDYDKIDTAGYSGGAIKNAVAKYIKGGREIIQETKYVVQGKDVSIWR